MCVDTAGGDFGFGIAFGRSGSEGPVVELRFQSCEGGIRVGSGRVKFEPARGETIGKNELKSFAYGGEIAMSGGAESGGEIAAGGYIQMDGLAFVPIGGDLKDRGTAEATMSEEHLFAEGDFSGRGNDFGGDTGEIGVALLIGAIENKRNEGGSRGNKGMAELAGEVVTEGGGAHFRNGEAAGGNNEDGCAKFGGISAKKKFSGTGDFRDAGVEENLDVRGTAFGFEEIANVSGGIVAEELTESFFVIGDVMFLEEGEEIGRSVTGKGGFGEMGIGGKEILGRGVDVGEIAAATTRDEDFFADAVGMFEDSYAAAAFAGFEGTEETGGAGAEDQDVKRMGQKGLRE